MAEDKNEVKKKGNYEWLIAVVYLIVGGLFIYLKGGTMNWLMTAVGAAFIVLGVVEIIRKNYKTGIFSTVVGIVAIVFGWLLVYIGLMIFGLLMAVKSVMDLPAAIKSKKPIPIVSALVTLVIGAALAACGLGLSPWLFNIMGMALDIIFIVIGVIFVVNGVMKLISFFQLKKEN